jgi:iron(III) transport system permease protein
VQRHRVLTTPVPLLALAIVAAALLLVPVGFVVWVAISEGWSQLSAQVFRPGSASCSPTPSVCSFSPCRCASRWRRRGLGRGTHALPGRKIWAIALASRGDARLRRRIRLDLRRALFRDSAVEC